jgi:hypothetical protein
MALSGEAMSKRRREITKKSIEGAQAKAKKAKGWLSIESKAGRLFLASPSAVRCKPTEVEFVDQDDWHIKLAYDQIAGVEIKDPIVNPSRSRHRRVVHS